MIKIAETKYNKAAFRHDSMDIIINRFGTRIRKSGERIVLFDPKGKTEKEFPVRKISKIIVLAPSSISAGAVSLALEYDIDIVFLGKFGMPVGRLIPSKKGSLSLIRQRQAEAANSGMAAILAKKFIEAKGNAQLSFLKFLSKKYEADFSQETIRIETYLDSLHMVSGSMPEMRSNLLALEGNIAGQYFRCIRKLVDFPGRVTRNAKDSVNVMLNYGYGILYNELERNCLYTGLDPYIGFYHADRYGQMSLIFDLIEEFRVPLVDVAVVGIIIKNANRGAKFVSNGVLLKDGKRILVTRIYSRLNKSMNWHGQRIKVREAVKAQVLHLAHYLTGREKEYIPFKLEDYHPWR
ncbi:MAG: CRISPR-associated endonuclease Cas1 [Candidatus Aenigmarchaeota archaeon]|nr:CRISPR-associated endonuclease Cas1 [Candidatus Aenigmarchaeota archaeon]